MGELIIKTILTVICVGIGAFILYNSFHTDD